MTYLQMVNAVLRRLREDEVATVEESTYSKMIRDFVLESVQEVESARNWNALRATYTINTSADVYGYSLVDVPQGYNIQYLHREGADVDLKKAPSANWMTHQYLSSDTTGAPAWYDVNGVDSNGDPVMNLYPIPNGTYEIHVNLKVNTTDDPVDATPILLPQRPILLRAYQFAVEERGDIGSDSLSLLEERYRQALGSAVEYDLLLNEDETVWFEE